MQVVDYNGVSNGSLTIIDFYSRKKGQTKSVVMCTCGAIDVISPRDVKFGNTTSCKRFINYKVDHGSYYEVFMHNGKSTLIDKQDYNKYFSNRSMNIDSVGYAFISVNNRTRLHRIIMPDSNGRDVDHINGDRLDNRKENLRYVTRQENLCNKLKRKNTTSKYKGVCKIKDSKWVASCQSNGKRLKHIFNSETEAAEAYDKYALELHGEYAKTNAMLGLFA